LVYAILLIAYIYVIFFLARRMSRGEAIGPITPQSEAAIPRAMPAE
jgi:cytochrome d ubiquinol oxidase subunit I